MFDGLLASAVDILAWLCGFALAMKLAVALYGRIDLAYAWEDHRGPASRRIFGAFMWLGGAVWVAGSYRETLLHGAGVFVVLHLLNFAAIRASGLWALYGRKPGRDDER